MSAGVVRALSAAVLLALSVSAQSPDCGRSDFTPAAETGAAFSDNPADFPWLVSVHSAGRAVCAGTVLSERWILTGATCTQQNATLTAHSAVLRIDSDTPGAQFDIESTVVHPQFNPPTSALYNIALLRTTAPIPLPTGAMKSLCLPTPGPSVIPAGRTFLAAGWGAPTAAEFTPRLKWARLTASDEAECRQSYAAHKGAESFLQGEDLLCTQFTKTESFQCGLNIGDQGTPLLAESTEAGVKRWRIVGLHVAGVPCGTGSLPDINVALGPVTEWISSVIAQQY